MKFLTFFRNGTTQKYFNVLLEKENVDMYYREQYRALRAKVEQIIGKNRHRVIAVTSAIAGEGKTTACVNLAIALASAGSRKVLLVDADLRKGDVASCLNMGSSPGMSELLPGLVTLKQALRPSTVPGLSVITGGANREDPTNLLTGERTPALMKEVREHFDIIIVDTPPVLPVADTLSLKNLVDGFVFIFRLGFTPYQMLGQAVEEIEETNLIGVVLNCSEPNSKRYYQRYYGKYYHQETKKMETRS